MRRRCCFQYKSYQKRFQTPEIEEVVIVPRTPVFKKVTEKELDEILKDELI